MINLFYLGHFFGTLVLTYNMYLEYNRCDSEDYRQWQVWKAYKVLSNGGPSETHRFFLCHFWWEDRRFANHSHLMFFRSSWQRKTSWLMLWRKKTGVLAWSILILQLVTDERSQERPNPQKSKADNTKPCTWQSYHLCLPDSKDETRRDYAHRDGNERNFAGRAIAQPGGSSISTLYPPYIDHV